MNKPLAVMGVSVLLSLGIVMSGSSAFAQPRGINAAASKVVFPIAELGNCTDQKNCEVYCEQVGNMQRCIDFAKKNALLERGDIEKSERVIRRIAEGKTPGQCKTRGECENFCHGNGKNMKACVAFAEEMDILPPAELAQAKKVAQALEGGAKLPGTCTDKESCDAYCSEAGHMDECLAFAEKADLIPANEIAEARKVASFLKDGTTPGGCKTKEECKNYCDDESHFTECINFAEKAGFASKADAEMARKTGGKGPGGCKTKEACSEYCNEQDHADECMQFGIAKGLISEEDQKNMEQASEKIQQGLAGIDPEARREVEGCLQNKMGADVYRKLMAKEIKPTQKIGESIQYCFESTMKNYAEKIKAKMMREGRSGNYNGGGIPSGMMPKAIPESIREQIPQGMSQAIPESIRELIPTGVMPQGIPAGINQQIPSSMAPQVPATGSGAAAPAAVSPQAIPAGYVTPQITCDMYRQVPSCDMIPDPVAAEACRKCR